MWNRYKYRVMIAMSSQMFAQLVRQTCFRGLDCCDCVLTIITF